MSKCGLFLFFGEAFRDGSSNCRIHDTSYGFENQKEASESHNVLIQCLMDEGWNIDVAINSYKSRYETELLDMYKNIVYYNFPENKNLELRTAVGSAIRTTFESISIDKYEFVFMLRLDLYLKQPFVDTFDPNWCRIMYMNAMHYVGNTGVPHVSDPLLFFPKTYFFEKDDWKGLIFNADHLLFHQAVYSLVSRGLTLKDIGFVSKHIYATNTLQHSNPFFRLNGRPEGPEMPFHVRNTLYDEETGLFDGEIWS